MFLLYFMYYHEKIKKLTITNVPGTCIYLEHYAENVVLRAGLLC